MVLFMFGFMFLVISIFNVGLIDNIIIIWFKVWVFVFCVVFFIVIVVVFLVYKLINKLIRVLL